MLYLNFRARLVAFTKYIDCRERWKQINPSVDGEMSRSPVYVSAKSLFETAAELVLKTYTELIRMQYFDNIIYISETETCSSEHAARLGFSEFTNDAWELAAAIGYYGEAHDAGRYEETGEDLPEALKADVLRDAEIMLGASRTQHRATNIFSPSISSILQTHISRVEAALRV